MLKFNFILLLSQIILLLRYSFPYNFHEFLQGRNTVEAYIFRLIVFRFFKQNELKFRKNTRQFFQLCVYCNLLA